MGRYVEARRHLDEALSIAREIGEGVRIANALMLLGRVAHGQGDMAAARAHFEESLALARSLGDKHRLASTLNALGELHRAQGDLDLAEPIYEEALALRREQGDASNIAVNLLNLVMVSIGRGSAARAHAMLLEALTIAQATASKRMGQGVLEVSAALGAFHGETQRAATMYGAAEAQREQMGLAREPVDEASLAPLIRDARRALGDAAFAAAERAGRALSYEDALGQARAWLQVACSRSADTMASIGDSSRPV
jgi:tetratricopeptide (TPR) repeat protein